MNEAGVVAFRADPMPSVSGIFVGDGASTTMVADTRGCWSQFYGLPVINNSGTVVFCADTGDGAPMRSPSRKPVAWPDRMPAE